MTKSFVLLAVCCAFSFSLMAQSNNTLLTIDGNDISKDEFLRIYTKNNQEPAFDKKSIDEYMELFINYKLKVLEAVALGFDTTQTFITELKGYRAQLEKPYFTDNSADSILIYEAYERMKQNVRASHILIKCDQNQLPADTLKAYNKIESLRKRAIKGEDFAKLAIEYSEDPSAKKNNGDLGFFGAFQMVYEFETAAFNTPVGQFSEIFRTRFGYHFLKVTDKRPDPGMVHTAHIMRALPQGSTEQAQIEQKNMIYAIYDSLKMGALFSQMAIKYSDDKASSQRGGEFPPVGIGRMIPEYENAAFALNNPGEYSEPFKSSFGWHIVYLIKKTGLNPIEQEKANIKSRISKDIRAQRGHQMVIKRLKDEYKFVEYRDSLKYLYNEIDSTILDGKWTIGKLRSGSKVLFTIADTIVFKAGNFAGLLNNDGLKRTPKPIQLIVDEEYQRFVEKSIMDFEKTKLEQKYPEFKNLLKEYHDGILLFNLTDKMVWTKAIEDTAGLEQFYNQNKNNYMWPERVEATIYSFNNKKYEKQIAKLAKASLNKKTDYQANANKFIEKTAKTDTTFTLQVMRSKFTKSENENIDKFWGQIGVKPIIEADSTIKIIAINRIIEPEPKLLSEAKGLITADYQNFLEKEWILQLRSKYSVKINNETLNSIIQ